VQASSYVNEAYRILSNPVDRAGYLLQQTEYTAETTDHQLTPEFLLRQIQLREELETIPGTESPRECLLELRERIEREIETLYASFGEQMRHRDFAAAGDIVRKLQFFQRLQDEMDELQFELEEDLDCSWPCCRYRNRDKRISRQSGGSLLALILAPRIH
jgi:molecular chaperone HscB